MDTHERLALRRKRAGLSQRQVARLSGLSRTNVSNVERGEARPELVGKVRQLLERVKGLRGPDLRAFIGAEPDTAADAFADERREARASA